MCYNRAMEKKKVKMTKLEKVERERVGKPILNGIVLEPHEESTILLLTQYGFTVEALRPDNAPKSDNPDFLMLGTIWETKSPETANENTLKKRIHKASKQADHVVFDLRRVPMSSRNKAKNFLLKMFQNNRNIRRAIFIETDDLVVDMIK